MVVHLFVSSTSSFLNSSLACPAVSHLVTINRSHSVPDTKGDIATVWSPLSHHPTLALLNVCLPAGMQGEMRLWTQKALDLDL